MAGFKEFLALEERSQEHWREASSLAWWMVILQQTDVNIMDFLGGHLKSQMEPEAALKTLNTLRAASSGLSNVNYNNQTIHNNNQMKHSLVFFLRPETLFPLCAGPQHLLCPDQREKVKLVVNPWWVPGILYLYLCLWWGYNNAPGILSPVGPVTQKRSLCGWSLSWLGSDLTYVVEPKSHLCSRAPQPQQRLRSVPPKTCAATKTISEKKVSNMKTFLSKRGKVLQREFANSKVQSQHNLLLQHLFTPIVRVRAVTACFEAVYAGVAYMSPCKPMNFYVKWRKDGDKHIQFLHWSTLGLGLPTPDRWHHRWMRRI